MDVKEDELQALYDYVDELPLSRPKKNIGRDFADGVLVAELVNHEAPRIVEVHNYSSANSVPQKMYNWNTLNQKVFRRYLGFALSKAEMEAVCSCEVGAIERILKLLRVKLESYKKSQHAEKEIATESPRKTPSKSPLQSQGNGSPAATQKPSAVATFTIGSDVKQQIGGTPADQVIRELRDTNELLSLKAAKLEQLVALKDAKIQTLNAKLREVGH